MVDFAALLTPEQREELEARRTEVLRMHGLADRWLAEELLALVRTVRSAAEGRLGQAKYLECPTYDTSFVWGLVPEIAFRLGATRFQAGERASDYSSLDAEGLRDWVGQSFQWVSRDIGLGRDLKVRGVRPWDLLTAEPVNGNPVAIALDRVAPPSPASGDWLARHMREISARRGFDAASAWSPELNGPASAADAEPGLPSFGAM